MDAGKGEDILLDVSRLVWRAWQGLLPTGIDRTCLAYVDHYRMRALAVVQRGGVTSVLSKQASVALFDLLLEQGAEFRGRLLGLAGAWLRGALRRGEWRGRFYLNVGHTGLDRPGHAKWIERSGVRPIYFLHDLIPLTHPEYCRAGEPQKHLRRMTALLRNAVGIIGNSRDTLNELAIFAGLQRTLPTPPSLVAPLGVTLPAPPTAETLQSPLPSRPYFVMLGTIEGRKNHLLILTIWAGLARRLGAGCPQLVIIGKRGWESEQAVDMLERSEAIRGHVIELPRCDDEMLAAYMRGACALLFPSFVEGYGLPLVEALSSGTPVIVSDLPVFHELAGAIPDYLSPVDGLGWARAIESYAQADSGARDAQRLRMSGWQAPSWRDHFAKVDRWLGQLETIQPQSASTSSG